MTRNIPVRVCVLAVCHDSYEESLVFLKSVSSSVQETEVELELYFIDNSEKVHRDFAATLDELDLGYEVRYERSENLGYFPSIAASVKRLGVYLPAYDYVIVSNVDLCFDNRFFSVLRELPVSKRVGAYAPSIRSSSLGVDRNPKIVRRPSARKLRLNRWLFRHSLSYAALRTVSRLRLKARELLRRTGAQRRARRQSSERSIYAPHGSCVVLTREFVRREENITYPIFLFCEEIYIGEKAREFGLDVVYKPDLVVYDEEHASTSLMKPKAYRDRNVEALSYILDKYEL